MADESNPSGRPPASAPDVAAIGAYELWFVAQLTLGLVYLGGAMFLLPPFVLSLPESGPGDVGVVMAVLPLIALGSPLVGGLLDRFGSYRLFQHGGLVMLSIGFGILALADEIVGATVGSLVLGIGAALVMTTDLGLLAGSGLKPDSLADRMSMLQMSMPVGQVLGLVVVAGLLAVDVGFAAIFGVMAVLSLVGLGATAATNDAPARRSLAHTAAMAARSEAESSGRREPGSSPPAVPGGFRAVVLSGFGLVLLVVFLSMAAHSVLESQYPNFMGDVFGIDGEMAATGLAVAVLVSIPVYPMVARWARSVPLRVPLLVGIAARGATGLVLWLLADIAGLPDLVPLVVYGLMMVTIPLTDVTGSLLAATSSPIGPSGGQGGYAFALAASAVAGAFLAGWAAAEFGYRTLALIVAVLAGLALVAGAFIPASIEGESEG